MSKKTNIDYLRHILDTLGNLMGENNYKESIEWLDSIQEELDAAKSLVTDNEDKITVLEEEIGSLKSQLEDEKKEPEYENEIDTGYGNEDLKWSCGNLAVDSMMEEMGEAIGRGVQVQKIENVLRAL